MHRIQRLDCRWVWRLGHSLAAPLACGRGILGRLGPVLILIRPGDEKDMRPIKKIAAHPQISVAQRLVQEVTLQENQSLCNPVGASVPRWCGLTSRGWPAWHPWLSPMTCLPNVTPPLWSLVQSFCLESCILHQWQVNSHSKWGIMHFVI